MTPAEFIKARQSIGLSQAQLAKALDLSIRSVSRYETGDNAIRRVVELAMWALVKQNKSGAKVAYPPPFA